MSVFRSLHGLLGYQRSSALFRPVCLSSTSLSVFNLSVCLQPVCLSSTCLSVFNLSVYHLIANPIACASFSPPHPPLVDSLDSKLWYRSGCRAAALASSSTEAVGQSFRQLFTTRSALQGVTSSLTAESPTIRSFKHPRCRYRDSLHPCPARKEDS